MTNNSRIVSSLLQIQMEDSEQLVAEFQNTAVKGQNYLSLQQSPPTSQDVSESGQLK